MLNKLIAGGLWAFTVSVGAWAYVEGKRIENAQHFQKTEGPEQEDEEALDEEEEVTPSSLPLGKVPWVAVEDRGQFRKRKPDVVPDGEWQLCDIEDIKIVEAKSSGEPLVF